MAVAPDASSPASEFESPLSEQNNPSCASEADHWFLHGGGKWRDPTAGGIRRLPSPELSAAQSRRRPVHLLRARRQQARSQVGASVARQGMRAEALEQRLAAKREGL
jgi:hypothetical protein